MERLLDNLWSNAVKYSEAGTVIKLHGDKKEIRMENISSKEVVFSSNLADPFIKGDPVRSGKTGSGLGLIIARNIAELHGYLLELFYEDGRFIVKISL
jgi:signal transduction histidine kinase